MNYIGNEPAPGGLVLVGDTNPVGSVVWGHKVPDGSYLALTGQIVSKVTFADLWVYAQGFLTTDQVVNPGLYKSIDASTFAVPILDGLFVRSTGGTAAALGVKQAEMIGPHTHQYGYDENAATAGGQGSLARTTSIPPATPKTTIVNTGTENRPANVSLVPSVKALKTVLMPATAMPAISGIGVLGPTAIGAAAFADIGPIPPGVKRVTLMVQSLSTVGVSNIILQLGRSGGVAENAGYLDTTGRVTSAVSAENVPTGFGLSIARAAASTASGVGTLCLLDPATNTWVFSCNTGHSDTTQVNMAGGVKVMAGALTFLRVTNVAAEAFDSGVIGAFYE